VRRTPYSTRGANRWTSFGLKELGNDFKIDGRRLKVSGVGPHPCALASSD